MELVIFSVIVAISLIIQYTLYKNPHKIIELRTKFGFRRKSGVFNRNAQAGFLEDVDLLRRRYKTKMTVIIVVYLLIMASQFMN